VLTEENIANAHAEWSFHFTHQRAPQACVPSPWDFTSCCMPDIAKPPSSSIEALVEYLLCIRRI